MMSDVNTTRHPVHIVLGISPLLNCELTLVQWIDAVA